MISFLDVLVIRNNNTIETNVYRKKIHSDIYPHWESFIPEAQKLGTFKTLLYMVHAIYSNKRLSEKEVKHLKHVFITINSFYDSHKSEYCQIRTFECKVA